MKVLAIETATENCTVALWRDGKIMQIQRLTPQSHASDILPMVRQLMEEQSIVPEQLSALAFGRGPGAFTGLRIASAVVQGLALGWTLPVVGVETLAALAWQARQKNPWSERILTLLDARMGELYGAVYDDQNRPLLSPRLIRPEAVESLCDEYEIDMGAGRLPPEYPELVQDIPRWQTCYPEAKGVAALASERISEARLVTERIPVPLYLRDQVTERPRQRPGG